MLQDSIEILAAMDAYVHNSDDRPCPQHAHRSAVTSRDRQWEHL